MSGHCYCINGNHIWCISYRHSVRQRFPIQDIFWWPKSWKPAWKRWIWLFIRSFLGTEVKQMLEMKLSSPTIHYGSEQPDVPAPNNSLSHELESEWASEQTNECSWERGRCEQNGASKWMHSFEWVVQVNERMDKQVAQYSYQDSWLFLVFLDQSETLIDTWEINIEIFFLFVAFWRTKKPTKMKSWMRKSWRRH